MNLYFKQFRTTEGCLSYLIGDFKSKVAVLVDPRTDLTDSYLKYLATFDFSCRAVVDTHTHADHYSGSHMVAQKLAAPIMMSATTSSKRCHKKLNDHEVIDLAPALSFKVLHTPGHTNDSVCLSFSVAEINFLLTGDTLLFGSTGRTDFIEADNQKLYESIYHKIWQLPDNTFIYPAHDYNQLQFSNLKTEKLLNHHLQFKDKFEDFNKLKTQENFEYQNCLDAIVQYNLAANPAGDLTARPLISCATVTTSNEENYRWPRLDAASLQQRMQSSAESSSSVFVDIRERDEYAKNRITGTINIPLSEVFLYLNQFENNQSKYFICQQANRTNLLCKTLVRMGYQNNVADLAGGMMNWMLKGLPFEKNRL